MMAAGQATTDTRAGKAPAPDPLAGVRAEFRKLVQRLGGTNQAARRLGCSPAYVAMIRAGQRRPGMATAWAIEQASEGGITMQRWMAP